MDSVTEAPGYFHTQKAPLCLILYGSALACCALAWIIGSAPGSIIAVAVGLLIALLAPAFHHLTIVDDGDRLAIRFGPLPLFRRTVRYADIVKVEIGRTLILEGWGIHYSIRGGWVWNLGGRDCLIVHLKKGVLRIGTNRAAGLAHFLEEKIALDEEESSMDTAATVRSDFATRLYSKLAATEAGKNLFLSPFSIRVALAMCAVGARGEIRKIMADLIDAPESVEEQNRQYAALLKSINGEGERPFQLVTANALWGQKGYHFNPDYKKAVAKFYDGALHEVNFRAQPDEAVRTINAWVSYQTREKIKELIQRDFIDDDTRLILTNAIYFKGRWDGQFEMADTTDEDWHGPDRTRKVLTMHRKGGYSYYEADGFQTLDMPYEGGQLSLLVVLPAEKDGLTALEARWGTIHEQVTEGLHHEETVIVSLPRFTMETAFSLKPVLCALGAELAFSDDADFTGIGAERLKISEVVHKAFVEVNEEGTEAAAATAVGMVLEVAFRPPPEPKVFKADHPFLFFIRDRKTNIVLFSGRVLDPK
jgi:serpin B